MTHTPIHDSNNSNLHWLQQWYANQCDGEWEHGRGLKIISSDNPGWIVQISVENTPLEDVVLEYKLVELAENDWYGVSVKDGMFNGVGDPSKLDFLLFTFKNWVLQLSDPLQFGQFGLTS